MVFIHIGKAEGTILDWNILNVDCKRKGGIQREICHSWLRSSSKLSDLVQKNFHIKFRRNNKVIILMKGTEFVFLSVNHYQDFKVGSVFNHHSIVDSSVISHIVRG